MEEQKTFPVKFGEHVVGRGWVKNGDEVTITIDPVNQNVVDFLVGDAYKYLSIEPEPAVPQSNIVDHARRELERIGEEPDVIEWYCKTIRTFTEYGHSGGSASVTIPVLNELLQLRNLTPLTNDPREWLHHDEGVFPPDGVWQNIRNGEAFSNDGGYSYYLLSEGGNNQNRGPLHLAEDVSNLTTNKEQ